MKGISSHDGKMHGNVQTIERYDESKGHKPQRAKAKGGESGGEHEPSGHDEIKQVVMEHGPAHKIEITHGEGGEGGDHHVTSHHEDGHVHEATHDSKEMAYAHGAHAAGVTDSNALMEAHVGGQDSDALAEAGHRNKIERNSHQPHAGGGFMPEHASVD